MKKKELNQKVDAFNMSTKEALLIILDALNQGQRKKIFKDATVAEMLARYGITE